jgi:hypothetical protein
LERWVGVMWTGLIWLRLGTGGELLWIRYWTFGLRKLLGDCWVAEQLVASRVVLSSTEVVISNTGCLQSFSQIWTGLEFLTAVVMKSSTFLDITPCSPLKVNRRFGGICYLHDRLCGLVVGVLGYRSWGPGSIPGTTRKKRKKYWVWNGVHSASRVQLRSYLIESSGSCLENREYDGRNPSRWPRGTLYPQKLAITSPTSGGRSVGIVRSRAQAMEF